MGAVEVFARESVHPSIGERLSAVRENLGRRAAAIDEVRLLDPLEVFPKRWQEVLAKLPVKPASSNSDSWEPAKGFLGKLQKVLS